MLDGFCYNLSRHVVGDSIKATINRKRYHLDRVQTLGLCPFASSPYKAGFFLKNKDEKKKGSYHQGINARDIVKKFFLCHFLAQVTIVSFKVMYMSFLE